MRSVLVVAALMSCVLIHSADAFIYVVGGSKGWEVPPNPTFFEDWAKNKTFFVGDELVFPYRVGGQTVFQVSKEDYEKCTHEHVTAEFWKGPTVLILNQTGDYYFYSNIGTHCDMGQKLHVAVLPPPNKPGGPNNLPPRRRLLAVTESDKHLITADLARHLKEKPGAPVSPAEASSGSGIEHGLSPGPAHSPSTAHEGGEKSGAHSNNVAHYYLGLAASCFVAMLLI